MLTTFKGQGVRFGSGRAFWTPLLGAAFALPYPDLLCVRMHKQTRVRFQPRLSDRGPAKLVFQTYGSRTLPEAKEGADDNKEEGGKSVGPAVMCVLLYGGCSGIPHGDTRLVV